MRLPLLWALILLISLTTAATAQDRCTAELIAALKDNYHSTDATEISQAVYDTYCHASSTSAGGSYSVVSINYAEAQNACKTHDLKFFMKYNREISISILPPQAYDLIRSVCVVTNPIEMAVEQTGDSIVLHSRFRDVGNIHSAVINSFSYTTDSVKCDRTSPLRAGKILPSGGLVANCTRLNDAAIVFTINTSQGFQFTSLPAVPPLTYVLSLVQADDYLACTVNGSAVASITFGQRADQVINSSLHPGTNHLQCTIRDDHPCTDGQACWSYTYQLMAGPNVITALHDAGHGVGVRQPGPFDFEYTPPRAKKGSQFEKNLNKVPSPSLRW